MAVNWRGMTGFAGTVLLRAWLAFSASAVLGAIVFWIADRDDPLRSDDPYIVGFVLGVTAACFTVVYVIAETLGQRVGRANLKDWVYAGALTAWCLLLCAGRYGGGEAAPFFPYLALGSLISGLVAWPLCRFKPPPVLVATLSCCGLLFLALYGVVAVRMSQRW